MRHFWSKIPKRAIVDSKLRHFCFSEKLCSLTNLRMMISDIRILFLNSSPKISKSSIFGPQLNILFFFAKFCKQTKLRMLVSNMTIGFLNVLYKITKIRHFWLKTPKSSIFGLKLRHFLFLGKTLQLDKFEEVHFKYGNSFLKFQSQNTHLRNFLSKIQVFLFFHKFFSNQT